MAGLLCEGVIESHANGNHYTCSTGFVDLGTGGTAIDPVLAAGYIGAGFFALLPLWVAIIGGRALLRAIT